ncbi:hypothetical protein A3715_10435 [Oleiphilus sp. HI0009]|nr:hypothetical protein A3715_10435 [Oleiphilus sp. HI0009]
MLSQHLEMVMRPTQRKSRVKNILAQKDAVKSRLKEGMVLANSQRNLWAMFLKDASTPGQFRYQLFDVHGFYSHMTFNSLEEAFNDAFLCGFRYPEEGVLDRLISKKEWKAGSRRDIERNRYNAGEISFEEMMARFKKINAEFCIKSQTFR